MLHADSLTLLLTQADWIACTKAKNLWQLDLGKILVDHTAGDRLRLSTFGTKRLVWRTASAKGEVSGLPTALLKVSIPLVSSLAPVLEVRAKHPPSMTCAHVVHLSEYGVSSQFLPGCGQRSQLVGTSARPHSLPKTAELIALAQTSDTGLVELAARAMLANDAPETSQYLLAVLARVAQNRTPDGLIDLMTHLGSCKRLA
jgi:hypothetical protein